MNLRTHFEAANRINQEVNDSPLPSTDPELLQQVADGIAHLRACEKLISELSVFSANETKDDINPSDLKYLLVPYLLAELTLKQVDHDRRPSHLRAAKLQLEAFVEALARAELITSAECSELLAEGGGGSGLGGMASKREQRIARIRAERAARAQMEAVEAKLAAARGRSGADADDRDDDVDNLEREHALQWLHVAKYGAADTLDSIGQELPMLEEVERRRRDDPAFDESLRNPPPVERPAAATGRGLESFHIPHSSRQEAYERVMGQVKTGRVPGMHTIELDDWHAEEAVRITQAHLHQQEAAALKADAEERKRGEPQDAVAEAEELALRAQLMSMDDFKETHAKGSGNRHNRG